MRVFPGRLKVPDKSPSLRPATRELDGLVAFLKGTVKPSSGSSTMTGAISLSIGPPILKSVPPPKGDCPSLAPRVSPSSPPRTSHSLLSPSWSASGSTSSSQPKTGLCSHALTLACHRKIRYSKRLVFGPAARIVSLLFAAIRPKVKHLGEPYSAADEKVTNAHH